jgi:hypothetical protein
MSMSSLSARRTTFLRMTSRFSSFKRDFDRI